MATGPREGKVERPVSSRPRAAPLPRRKLADPRPSIRGPEFVTTECLTPFLPKTLHLDFEETT